MNDQERSMPEKHDTSQCAQAWVALRKMHAEVAGSLREALAACDLSVNEFEVLLHLRHAETDAMPLSHLGAIIELSQPALSRLVSRLERQGLVERRPFQGDRRAVVLGLTDKGRDLLARAIPIHAACVRESLAGWLTDEEQAVLVRALTRQ